MNAPATIPDQRREISPIEVLKHNVARRADDFKMVLPSHITVDKFQRTIATAALSNPKLLECDRQSLLIACMKLAQDGLLPDGREAALVPFKTRIKDGNQWLDKWLVQPMPMAWGLRKKVLQSGEVISLQVGVVYAAEVISGNFVYEIGIEPPIRHRPKLDMTEAEMADDQLVAAYSIARIKSDVGDPYWSVEVMRRGEVLKVRQMSQTGALGKVDPRTKTPIPPKGPWVDWEPEMWKKTVLRRHTKVLPMSGDILDMLERDDAEEKRANGVAKLLETEAAAPVRLPNAEDLASAAIEDRSGTEAGAPFDPETGEVLERDAATGMTQVDEETARHLDDAASGQDTDERPIGMVIYDAINAASTAKELAAADADYVKVRASLSDSNIEMIDAALVEKRAAIKQKA